MPFSGTALRGPALNDQTLPSVRPAKWQLAQFCQPSLDSRLVLPPSNTPREAKKISLPTCNCSSCEPASGCGVTAITRTTLSLSRLTTETLRDT